MSVNSNPCFQNGFICAVGFGEKYIAQKAVPKRLTPRLCSEGEDGTVEEIWLVLLNGYAMRAAVDHGGSMSLARRRNMRY